MLKKGSCIFAILIIASVVWGRNHQQHLANKGFHGVESVADVEKLSVKMDADTLLEEGSRFPEEAIEGLAEETVEEADYALVGKATGKLNLEAQTTRQEIAIDCVIDLRSGKEVTGQEKGIAAHGENVWVSEFCGLLMIEYSRKRELSYYDCWINLMEEGETYVAFVSENPYNKNLKEKIYPIPDNAFYPYFNLQDKAYAVDVDAEKAVLSDFKGTEVITNQKEEVDSYLRLKHLVFEKCCGF